MNFEYINKYPEVDPFRYRNSLILLGLTISLLLAFVFFNMTSYGEKVKYSTIGNESSVMEFFPPPTREELTKPKIPPPAVIELIPVEKTSGSDKGVEFLNSEVDIHDKISYYSTDTTSKKNVKIPPPEVNRGDNDPIIYAEVMPRFPGCEDKETIAERETCAQQKLMEYIYSNLKYPSLASESSIEGRVTLRFVVTETGKVENVEILRDIGAGCGEEAKKVIENMNDMEEKWLPGRQAGRKVKVFFTLPIVFKLN